VVHVTDGGTTATGGDWEFTDDRGGTARAAARPARVVAYVRAGAALWELGVRPVAVYGSGHDGPEVDRAKAGRLPDGIPYLGAGKDLDADALAAARPDLLVDVTYDNRFAYAVDDGTAERLGVPVTALSVSGDTALAAISERFTALAAALGGAPPPGGAAELAAAQDAVRAAAGARPARVLVLSAAGPEQAYVARPEAWPELRLLTGLGVHLVDPGPGPGVNWATVTWEQAAALGADLVLTDSRGNAAPAAALDGVPGWRALTGHAPTAPWNPELPPTDTGTADFLRTVAAALSELAAR
jgi:iron complex transport system substrate-binding protein